jgi:uncharacterized membrane protein YphA (DoxX/SURF4 family)
MNAKKAPQSNPAGGAPLFVVRIFLGAVFVVSGFQKLIQPPQNFMYVVQNFEFLPEWAEFAVAHAFPWFELLGGLFLVCGLWTSLSLRVLWLACSAFVVILTQAIIRNLPIESCGCFGEMIRMPLPAMLGFDVVLWILFGLLVVFDAPSRRFSLDNRLDRP